MRIFVEEITVRDSAIADRIIKALETNPVNPEPTGGLRNVEPKYEIDLYEHNRDFDPVRNKTDERPYITLKIFVREELVK